MLRVHQFLILATLITVIDFSLKTSVVIIQRDLLWTMIVFAAIALWDFWAGYSHENQSSDAL